MSTKCDYFPGAIAVSSGVFGDDLDSSLVYSVMCSGNETGILQCSHSLNYTCTSEHSAAVICQGLYDPGYM